MKKPATKNPYLPVAEDRGLVPEVFSSAAWLTAQLRTRGFACPGHPGLALFGKIHYAKLLFK
jgi:hypothetical protein